MARNTTTAATKATTSRAALVKKALAESNKSAGMRLLFEAGMTVVEVQAAFGGLPYGYVYGVAKRGGFAETAAARRAPRKAQASRPVAKKATATRPSTASKVQAARAPKGRPSAARRAENRKPRVVAAPAKTSAASKRAAASNR